MLFLLIARVSGFVLLLVVITVNEEGRINMY